MSNYLQKKELTNIENKFSDKFDNQKEKEHLKMSIIKDIQNILSEIEYGFKDDSGSNIINDSKRWNNEFYKFYYLLTPEELLTKKCGVCWDQVELERSLFLKNNINVDTYFICTYDNDNLPSHTFLTISINNKYYWFENSWNKYKGLHEYNSIKSLLQDVKYKFVEENTYVNNNFYTFIYKYQKPKMHISCDEFYKYIEQQELIKINEPLYFYHLVNKDRDISNGLISIKYMYDNKLYDLFDKYVEKYKSRIINDWNISKYKGKTNLSREEYLDALNLFRGDYGTSYIYFFRYPPFKELGKNMAEILKYKDIYRININDEDVMKNIKDIFYGYDFSNSDNKLLNKKYYEDVTEEEYFENYDDNIKMNFSRLNHIAISFINDFCPNIFLTKIEKDGDM